jgi:hypothetical protein
MVFITLVLLCVTAQAGSMRSCPSINRQTCLNSLGKGGGSRGVRLGVGRRRAVAAGVAPVWRSLGPPLPNFPPVPAVGRVLNLPALLLAVGGSPLPWRT